MSNLNKIEKRKLKIVPKAWGFEGIIESNSRYCGKILGFKKVGAKFSFHMHHKEESWYCSSGAYLVKTINMKNAERSEMTFIQGDVLHVPPMCPHQIICVEPGEIFEVSTEDKEDDSYRIEPGDSQKS